MRTGLADGTLTAHRVWRAGATNVPTSISEDDRVNSAVSEQVGVAAGSGVDFVPSDQIGAAAVEAGLDEPTSAALVDSYESAQLQALKTGLLVAGLLALVSLAFTEDLPRRLPDEAADADIVAGSHA